MYLYGESTNSRLYIRLFNRYVRYSVTQFVEVRNVDPQNVEVQMV
jgi:hypothetical protein